MNLQLDAGLTFGREESLPSEPSDSFGFKTL